MTARISKVEALTSADAGFLHGCAGENFTGIYPFESPASGGTLLTIYGSFNQSSSHACRLMDLRNLQNTPVTG